MCVYRSFSSAQNILTNMAVTDQRPKQKVLSVTVASCHDSGVMETSGVMEKRVMETPAVFT